MEDNKQCDIIEKTQLDTCDTASSGDSFNSATSGNINETSTSEPISATNTESADNQPNINDPSSTNATDNDNYTITEAGVEILSPKHVFYNPVQEFNRDLSIAVIQQYALEYCSAKKIKILEALGATGLRSIRFAKELTCDVDKIVCNDFDKQACDYISRNIQLNGVQDKVEMSYNDASALLHSTKHSKETQFDVIDLDPYGSPTPFLDSALQSIKDGGLLCVTCTDTGVLCGNGAETCFTKYSSVSIRSKFCHEMALRIVVRCLDSHANRYSRYVEPILCLSVDFYVRLFVIVRHSQLKAKLSCSKSAMLYHCTGCGDFNIQPLSTVQQSGTSVWYRNGVVNDAFTPSCQHCSSSKHLAGPFYNRPIHNREFIYNLLKTIPKTFKLATWPRIEGMLHMAAEELPDSPFYFIMDNICKVIHCTTPTIMQFRSAILDAGYNVSFSHCAKNSVKTNAPTSIIWNILRCWLKLNPISEKRRLKNESLQSPGSKILSSPEDCNFKVSFEVNPLANPHSRASNMLRWQTNPTKDWGPQARACFNKLSLDDRRKNGIEKANQRKINKRNNILHS